MEGVNFRNTKSMSGAQCRMCNSMIYREDMIPATVLSFYAAGNHINAFICSSCSVDMAMLILEKFEPKTHTGEADDA